MMRQRKEYLTLYYLNYIFVGSVVSTLVYYFFFKTELQTVPPPQKFFVIPETKILTPEEISKERLKFSPDIPTSPDYSYSNPEISGNNSSLNTAQSGDVVSQNELIREDEENILEKQTSAEAAIVKEKLETPTDNGVTMSNTAPVAATDTLNSFAYTATADMDLPKSIVGTIYSINKQIKHITLTSDNGFITIITDDDTEFRINAKKISFSDLKVTDKINVEGLTGTNTNLILAKAILITGFVQLVPTN